MFGDSASLHAGENTVSLLYENFGYHNGGPGMEKLAGITHLRLAPRGSTLQGWRMKVVRRSKDLAEVAPNFNDSDWQTVKAQRAEDATQLKPKQIAVFRLASELTRQDIDARRTCLAVARMDDEGVVYVNGKKIGEGRNWEESFTFDAGQAVRVGRNVIAVVIKNNEGVGGLGGVQWTQPSSAGQDTAALEYSDQPAGVAGQWWKADFDDSAWTKQSLPATAADSPMLSWHRLAFELPTNKPNIWLPWLIRLHAKGNGFVCLNGHCIGRFWQRGGQTDYYLPECWLNFGPGRKNVVTLCLCPVDNPVAIESAVILPYTAYAEHR